MQPFQVSIDFSVSTRPFVPSQAVSCIQPFLCITEWCSAAWRYRRPLTHPPAEGRVEGFQYFASPNKAPLRIDIPAFVGRRLSLSLGYMSKSVMITGL